MTSEVQLTHLLWTGGWDSTFELLRQLFVHRASVVPIYLIDETRRSRDVEMRAMDRIRERIAALDADAGARLAPTWFARVDEVHRDETISDAFRRLEREYRIGSQYDWLARFCLQHGLDNVVLSYEDGRFGSQRVLRNAVVEEPWQGRHVHRVRTTASPDIVAVFGRYVLPLFEWTKRDMMREVDERGWRPVMTETWFCHRPVGDAPCARCSPCKQTIEAGLGWRIPAQRRAIGMLQRAAIDTPKRVARPVLRALRGDAPPHRSPR